MTEVLLFVIILELGIIAGLIGFLAFGEITVYRKENPDGESNY